jgi:membrane-bound lytic murein transglycosylase D
VAEFKAEERITRVAASKPEKRRPTARRPAVVTHRVRRGQTLSHIAKQHRVSVESLRRANRLGKSARIRTGQVLKISRSQSET